MTAEIVDAMFFLVVAGGIVEVLVGIIGKLVPERFQAQWQRLPYWVAMGFGMLISFVYSLDVFAVVGFTAINQTVSAIVGPLLTGVLISSGSNFINSMRKILQSAAGWFGARRVEQEWKNEAQDLSQ